MTLKPRCAITDTAEIMLKALDTELEAVRQLGACDITAGRIAEVRILLDRIERLQAIRNQAETVRDDLLILFPYEALDPDEPSAEDLDGDEMPHRQDRTGQVALNHQRGRIVDSLSSQFGAEFERHSQAMFRDDGNGVRAICTVSKVYGKGRPFWYAFHPHWDEFLAEARNGIFALGMIGRDDFVCLPHAVIVGQLENLHRTERPDGGSYWHLHVTEPASGRYLLSLPKASSYLDLTPYVIKLPHTDPRD
jgi:hypothetical protein